MSNIDLIYIEKNFVSSKKKTCILILPGFPAGKNKNEDIASYLSLNLKIYSFILHYPGIGKSSGVFGFNHSLEAADEVVLGLINQGYENIVLLGNSWGGFLSLSLLRKFHRNIKNLILISPLSRRIEDPNVLKAALTQYFENEGHRNRLSSIHDLFDEFVNLKFDFKLHDFDQFPSSLIIHGGCDEVVPIEQSKQLVEEMGQHASFEILESEGHDIANRNVLKKYIENFLGNSL